jgi:hypothetical protein
MSFADSGLNHITMKSNHENFLETIPTNPSKAKAGNRKPIIFGFIPQIH